MSNGPDKDKGEAFRKALEKAFPGCPVSARLEPAHINPEFSFPYKGKSRVVIIARSFFDDSPLELLLTGVDIAVASIQYSDSASVTVGSKEV